jgi:hypothetical protein
MKTKIKILLVSCVIAAVAVMGFNQESSNMDVSLADIAVMEMAIGEPGQNQATCYSTYTSPGIFGGGTNIYRCGTCVTVVAKSFSDPGICYF